MENQEILYLIKGIERDLKKIKDGITTKPKSKGSLNQKPKRRQRRNYNGGNFIKKICL